MEQISKSKGLFSLLIIFAALAFIALLSTSCATVDGQVFVSQNPSPGKANAVPVYLSGQCPHAWVTDKTTGKEHCTRCKTKSQ